MKFILRLQAEITVKSKTLRKRHGTVLSSNVRNLVKKVTEEAAVRWLWDKIEVEIPNNEGLAEQVRKALVCIPGIAHIEEVIEAEFVDFEGALQFVIENMAPTLAHKTFAVRIKRKGKHDFSSQDLAVYIGGGIRARVEGATVKLVQPEETVQLWLDNKTLSLQVARFTGIGGYPLPTQETVLSLISGGFDSAVASYQFIRRGARTHFCFFNLGGAEAHEAAVREVAYFIWQKYSSTHPVKFISVDLSPIVEAILSQEEQGVMGVLLKRAMLRAASLVASKLNVQALVTGEAMGQVSSQTLSNLQVIDEVTSTLVLRPLITMDKQHIVDIARDIGVEQMAAAIPEYCGVISKKPTVKAKRGVVHAAEAGITDVMIEHAVNTAPVRDIRDVHENPCTFMPTIIKCAEELPEGALVVDIRSPEEEDDAPLQLDGMEVEHIPFFKLARAMQGKATERTYVLYCQQGVMSRLQAISLKDQGFANLAVYEPTR
ncbi:tRNA uracil 4-sulfurtransferase ThiI [Aliidiomarina quisquiliarum]|uniref:tRNA uracil 4-sulfurtransferase ThiI n=1 Tax=Aliidiomarina quisquiliarum TaxID=2938947 RepID=UPI00208F9D5F|nr:tRNA uracil 4-sulfurtransferase ThiI [Aliidiomarina quisquiliarum]MCO4322695.1 tRNA 4-thiouridine(8) synthase ThiI [Aliidiomarina quisquiliarum]